MFWLFLTWTEMPRGATEIESIRLDFWPPFKQKSKALKRHIWKTQNSFKLIHSQTPPSLIHSQTHSLTDSHSQTHSLPHSPPFVPAVRSPPSFVAPFVLSFQVLGSLSFFSLCYFLICVMSYCKFEFFSVLGSWNFGFL